MMSFRATCLPGLPPLAWAAEIRANLDVSAICGAAVEIDERGLVAGAWSGDFGARDVAAAPTSIGTALRIGNREIVAHCGTAGSAPIFFSRQGSRLFAANTLAFALAAAGDRLDPTHPHYLSDFCTYFYGGDRYRHSVVTERGQLSTYYRSMSVGPDRALKRAPLPEVPDFGDYATYRAYLREQTGLLFANAADASRRQRYVPISAVSSGYDSSAAAVIAREAGCREGLTFGESAEQPDEADDSGIEIGSLLGLAMTEYGTFSYKARTDLPEVEFIASSFTAGQVFLSGAGEALAGRLLVGGIGGDWVWNERRRWRRPQTFPFFVGGYSEVEFLIRTPALSLALPMIGGRHVKQIDEIGRGASMRPWRVGGDYDRPIPRRIVEEAAIPRGTFAKRKRHVAVDYFDLNRRQPEISRYLSPTSLAAFEDWFARNRPMAQSRVRRHNFITETLGRVLWSGKLKRLLNRVGLDWPPFGHRFLRYKMAVCKNFYVFNWAAGIQTERYRKILTDGA
jgi:hypothetical protein